jgi:hypothetical protein
MNVREWPVASIPGSGTSGRFTFETEPSRYLACHVVPRNRMSVRNSPTPREIHSALLGRRCLNCPREATTRDAVAVDVCH